jgi:threonine dehydratase
MFSRTDLEAALAVVHAAMPPTPQYAWPLLQLRTGVEVVVKHENHTPTGAFKVRGGLVYMDRLKRERPHVKGVVSATRGNHGQSLAFAGARAGVEVTIVAPEGNAREKNAAMRAFGAELIEYGADFDEARTLLPRLAEERGYEVVPSFHPDLVTGVATYAHELFSAFSDLDTVYVPIGLGSGICGLIRTRDLLGLKTQIVGVVSDQYNAYAQSFAARRVIATGPAHSFADGMATRTPDADSLAMIIDGAARVVEVTDEEVADAIRIYHEDTHNLAEGAGAAPLAALIKERERLQGRRAGVILCGGNIDRAWAAQVLAGGVPSAG